VQIPIASIKVKEGRRAVRNFEQLAASIDEIGLLNPILVSEDHTLIAGLNRLRACESLGWDQIDAIVSDLDGLGAQLAEIDENLIRNELTELERAESLKRRKQITKAMYPPPVTETGGPGRGHKTSAESAPVSFVSDTASKTGMSKRSVQVGIQIAEKLTPEAKATISKTPAADNQSELLKLSKQPAEKQQSIARQIAKGIVSKVCEAEGYVGLPTPAKARKIALETGKPVAANNNTFVLPMSKQEQEKLGERQFVVRGIYEAITTLAEATITPQSMAELGPKHYCRDLESRSVAAHGWLTTLIERIWNDARAKERTA